MCKTRIVLSKDGVWIIESLVKPTATQDEITRAVEDGSGQVFAQAVCCILVVFWSLSYMIYNRWWVHVTMNHKAPIVKSSSDMLMCNVLNVRLLSWLNSSTMYVVTPCNYYTGWLTCCFVDEHHGWATGWDYHEHWAICRHSRKGYRSWVRPSCLCYFFLRLSVVIVSPTRTKREILLVQRGRSAGFASLLFSSYSSSWPLLLLSWWPTMSTIGTSLIFDYDTPVFLSLFSIHSIHRCSPILLTTSHSFLPRPGMLKPLRFRWWSMISYWSIIWLI